MASLFPFSAMTEASATASTALPLAVEVAWNFDTDTAIFANGAPVMVSGAQAVAIWCWHALHTERWAHVIFSPSYGSEISTLIGQTWTSDLKKAQVSQYLNECLCANAYVQSLDDMQITFDGTTVFATFTLCTIYGTVTMEVTS